MSRQDFAGDVQWIVVDDGAIPTKYSLGQEYVRVLRSESVVSACPLSHTVGDNLSRALPLVRSSKIVVIEDDDYYGPRYLSTMSSWLDRADLAGEAGSKYFRLDNLTCHHFDQPPFTSFAALARTGFRNSLIPFVLDCCKGDSSVDMRIWNRWKGSRFLSHPGNSGLHISIKGGPGRSSHNYSRKLSRKDPTMSMILEWSRGDWIAVNAYRSLMKKSGVVVFTAVTHRENGELYSRLATPLVMPRDIPFVAFSDSEFNSEWDVRVGEQDSRYGLDIHSRLWKFMPHRWFPNAEWTIYIDASMRLMINPNRLLNMCMSKMPEARAIAIQHPVNANVIDEIDWIEKQKYAPLDLLARQKSDYLAHGYGKLRVYQCGVLIRKNTPEIARLNEHWWQQLIKYGHRRDQPSFPVAAAMAGASVGCFTHREREQFTRWMGHTAERIRY